MAQTPRISPHLRENIQEVNMPPMKMIRLIHQEAAARESHQTRQNEIMFQHITHQSQQIQHLTLLLQPLIQYVMKGDPELARYFANQLQEVLTLPPPVLPPPTQHHFGYSTVEGATMARSKGEETAKEN